MKIIGYIDGTTNYDLILTGNRRQLAAHADSNYVANRENRELAKGVALIDGDGCAQ